MTHACDLCGGTAGTEIEPGIVVCSGCGFVYAPERRSPEAIAADWTNVYRSGAYDPSWPGVKARLYYVAEWLDQKIGLEGKSVLDIGAGTGFFVREVQRRGAQPVGLEPDYLNANHIRSDGIHCFTGSIETAPSPGQYDLVTILWTLENCGDCLAMLEYAKEALAPGGRVVVATGSRILVPFKKPYSSYFGKLSPDLHCFRWSRASLGEAMRLSGLAVEAQNDWRDRDEMLVVGRANEDCIKMPAGHDAHMSVVFFFQRWKDQWP